MKAPVLATLVLLAAAHTEARVVRLEITQRETVLSGRAFGLAGAYEKLSGTAHFALDPELPQNRGIIDLSLAPRNARGEVLFSADFFLLKPVDAARANGVLFYEAGNRGRKRILATFQKGSRAADPTTPEDFGTGALMQQGFSLLWLGWQWDVPEGRMRMEMPVAQASGGPITGLVRGNFILGERASTALFADRGHLAYDVVAPEDSEHFMTVRSRPLDPPIAIARERWRFDGRGVVALEGGFEPGKIYDVVYRSEDPKVVGTGLAGTRDIVSFFKHASGDRNPLPGMRVAIGWGVSQTGRFLRHFIYQGFNEDESGRIVFDGVIDQVGGAGRGSFNHRFGQASRDANQHFNIHFPVDMFPFTDSDETDPVTGATDSLLRRARASDTVPKLFHILTNSEYFNRGGSLVHTDPSGTKDAILPDTSRVYFIASAPHIVGRFPPQPNPNLSFLGQASLNPLRYNAAVRALFDAMARWVVDERAPPSSTYPRLADETLTAPENAGWPSVPGFTLPAEPLTPLRLDFGPDWDRGIVTFEPPHIGQPFVVRVPAVDVSGNDRAGIRLPEIAVPLATHTGWNYRHAEIGAPDRLSGEYGSYFPLAKTRAARMASGDSRQSLEERYTGKDDYLGKLTRAALELVDNRFLLAEDLPEILERATRHYDWAIAR